MIRSQTIPFTKGLSARARAERRGHLRTRAVLRVVQVEQGDDCGLATCRNISDTGMKLSLGLVVQLNDAIRISFSPTSRLEATVVWINGSECGVSFKEPIDSAELLSSTAAEVLAGTSRAPRVRINRRATLIAEGKTQMATINDVSQRGMKVTHDGSFRPGLHVTVMLDEHSEYRAVVRWVRDNFAGLMLLEPIGVAALGSARNL